jgi:prepilin-type N-terminal cleavage/methylation domain-containing protein
MLMTRLRLVVSRLRDPRGFTLIELLVAMIAGVIVLGALVVILEITINQTARIDETAQVNQTGRLTMTKIVDELQSACVARAFAPVQETSTPIALKFIAAFTPAADITASEAAEHEIVWSKSAETLTDKKYGDLTGENGTIKFSGTQGSASATRLGEKITEGSTEGPSSSHPGLFHYYKYNTTASGSTGTPETALTEISLAETAALGTSAKEVAAVVVTFKAGATHEELLRSETKAIASLPSEISDQVTFAFAAPTSESSIKDGPCQ